MQIFFTKKAPPYFEGGGDTMLYLHIFSHFQKLIPNFCGKNFDLSSKTTQPPLYSIVIQYSITILYKYKVMQYSFEIFQTVVSLNCNIIQLKTLNQVIKLTLVSNKNLNLFFATYSEINAGIINWKKICNLSYQPIYGLLCLLCIGKV